MKAYFEGDKDVFVFKPIPKAKRGRPKKAVTDIKCSPEARGRCPFCHPCDSEEKPYFEEGSPCDKFNKSLIPSPPPTNADHIRSMTDEELTEFLCDATYKENEQGYPIMRTAHKVWWRKWLKQPYNEDNV